MCNGPDAAPQITYAQRTMQLAAHTISTWPKNDDEVHMDGNGKFREFIISLGWRLALHKFTSGMRECIH